MPSFYIRPNSRESFHDQWARYLQQESFHKDIKSSISDGANQVARSNEAAAREISDSNREAAQRITGAIEDSTFQITGAIEDLRHTFDWRMAELIDAHRVTNVLLLNIADLLQIPDFQKERQYFIENGLRHYQNAISMRSTQLMEEALRNLHEAESREPSDYFVLHKLGLIYLLQPEFIDIARAEKYLKTGSTYAVADRSSYSTGQIQIQNRKRLCEADIQQIAAECYFYAGMSCYLQKKYGEAATLTQKAYETLPTLLEARFNQAKFLAAGNDIERSLRVLKEVILMDRAYAAKAASDGDLTSKREVITLLDDLRNDAVERANSVITKMRAIMLTESLVRSEFLRAEKLAGQNTYLGALASLDLVSEIREWNWSVSTKIPYKREPLLLETVDRSYWSVTMNPDSYDSKAPAVRSIAFNPDNSMLAGGCGDGSVIIWRVADGKVRDRFRDSKKPINSLLFSDDGKLLLCADDSKKIRVFDFETGRRLEKFKAHSSATTCMKRSRNGRYLGATSQCGQLSLWEFGNWKKLGTVDADAEGIASFDFNPDGATIAAGSHNGRITLWRVPELTLIKSIGDSPTDHRSLSFSPDGILVASASLQSGLLTIWDVESGDELYGLSHSNEGLTSLAFGSCGWTIVTGTRVGTFYLWGIPEGREISSIRGLSGIHSVEFSQDGEYVACGCSGERAGVVWHCKDTGVHKGVISGNLATYVDIEAKMVDKRWLYSHPEVLRT